MSAYRMCDWGPLLLRAAAIALAATAIADPACTRQRDVPLPVLVRSASGDAADAELVQRIREAVGAALGDRVDVDSPKTPGAIVLAGTAADADALPDGVPISLVAEAAASDRNVRVAATESSPVMLAGWTGTITARIEGTGAAGETSVIALEHNSVEIGRVTHRWQSDAEVFDARFEFVPPSPGVRALRVVARPIEGEATAADNHADLQAVAEDRKLRVLVHEPRPSWATTFIRRALEAEPIFDVAALSRPSRGIQVRAGAAPERLRPDSLADVDAIIVGAPEELRQEEIDALTWFARVRGGTFIFVPDRRPSGAYARMIPAESFQERLLENPVAIAGSGLTLRASELAVAVQPAAVVERLAELDGARGNEAVVFAWPVGNGEGVFVGALDAWRHRDRSGEFPAFWRARAAAAAAGSPRRLEAALDPGVALPRGSVKLRVRLRASEIDSQAQTIELPVVAARLVRADGSAQPIRLWPTSETGVFEGAFEAPGEGRHVVQASAAGITVDTTLVVRAGVRTARLDAPAGAALLASRTGGVVAAGDDLSPLIAHLGSLRLPAAAVPVHPARSAWWMTAFVLLVCAEWFIRRRRGLN